MSEEGDMEGVAPNAGTETGTLVEVKFQKQPYQTQKYLEAEPKALGITQIMLSLFFLSTIYLNWNYYFDNTTAIVNACFSSTSIIAGSVAIAAQNLHLPTLKACLGMQVVVCVFSVFSFLISFGLMVEDSVDQYCWSHNLNVTFGKDMCKRLWSIYEHITGLEILMQVTQIALSATLAAFCCKVIQCCSPRSNVPVIVVNTPPGPE